MEQKDSKIFDKKIMQAVSAFCSSNNIEDVDDFIYRCFKQGFDIEKYGFLGKTVNEDEKHLKTEEIKEKIVEVEVIKEIRVEVPVEVIKEVVVEKEVIKEVPVEKVVTKIEYVSDKTNENELIAKIDEIKNDYEQKIFHLNEELEEERQIFSTKTTKMENNFQNEISKKDNELDELRRNLDIPVTNDKVKMLQQTIQNLNEQIRELKKKNEELEKKLLDQPKNVGETPARFHGSSNLNDNLYK